MSDSILVTHSTLQQISSDIAGVGDGVTSQAGEIRRASDDLSANWQGQGSEAFAAAAQTIEQYLQASAAVLQAESQSVTSADTDFSAQDTKLATGISAAGR